MSNFCSNCGAKLDTDNAFCPECGNKLAQEQPPVASVESATKPTGHFYDTSFANSGYRCDNGFKENFLKGDGRLNRLRYFKRICLISFICFIVTALLSVILIGESLTAAIHDGRFMLVQIIIAVPSLYIQYQLMRRRLQDLDKGYMLAKISVGISVINIFAIDESAIAYLLMLVELGISLYLLLAKGTTGDNQYGPDPLAAK